MSNLLHNDPRPNRAAAMKLIEGMGGGKALAAREAGTPSVPSTASTIANTTAMAIREAVSGTVGYCGAGGELNAELDVAHRDPDGGETRAKVIVRFTRGKP